MLRRIDFLQFDNTRHRDGSIHSQFVRYLRSMHEIFNFNITKEVEL